MRSIILFIIILFLLVVIIPISIEARSDRCSHHGGVCWRSCCDEKPLSSTCAPYYSECNGSEEAGQILPIFTPPTNTPFPLPTWTKTPLRSPTRTTTILKKTLTPTIILLPTIKKKNKQIFIKKEEKGFSQWLLGILKR